MKAAIAQLVEHIIRNDGVGGSNPSCGTNLFNEIVRSGHRAAAPQAYSFTSIAIVISSVRGVTLSPARAAQTFN